MKTLKEKVQEIRSELKKEGITARQVSIRGKNALYDESITCTIKDLNVNINKVREIAEKQGKVEWDDYAMEILQGGNTFVHVQLDYKAVEEAKKDFIEKAEKIFEDGKEYSEGSLMKVKEENNLVVLYSSKWFNCNSPCIELHKRDSEGFLERIKRYNALDTEGIAEALVMFKYQNGLNV